MSKLLGLCFSLMLCLTPGHGVAEDKQFKVGVLLPLTGSMASWGENARRGLELAEQYLNTGGLKEFDWKVDLVIEDFGDLNLKLAVTAAQKLISIDKVRVLFTFLTEDTEVVWKIAAQHQIPVIAMAAGAEDITSGRPNVFRISPSDTALIDEALRFVSDKNKKRLCVISQEIAYFDSMAAFLNRRIPKILTIKFNPTDKDFRSGLARLKSEKCDVVFGLVLPDAMPTFLQQMKTLQFSPLTFGPPATDEVASSTPESVTEGVLFPRFEGANPFFVKLFREKYNSDPGITSDYAFDSLTILSKVINEYGSSPAKIEEGLSRLTAHAGASGQIDLSLERARASRGVQMWIIENGKARIIKER